MIATGQTSTVSRGDGGTERLKAGGQCPGPGLAEVCQRVQAPREAVKSGQAS